MTTQLKSMYKDYFQKSRVFLHPALEIKRGTSISLIQTYVSWKGVYSPEDMKFCALYHLREDQEFKNFERQRLRGNKFYHDFIPVEDCKGVYVFDLSEFKEDWNHFLAGKYSLFTDAHKKKILDWHGTAHSSYAHVESFLYPEKYFRIYSELSAVDIYHLKKVGQLCDKPNMTKETLEMSPVNLDIAKKLP